MYGTARVGLRLQQLPLGSTKRSRQKEAFVCHSFFVTLLALTSAVSDDGIVGSFSTVMDIFPIVLELARVPPVGTEFRWHSVCPDSRNLVGALLTPPD
jgi:hypothetical protein